MTIETGRTQVPAEPGPTISVVIPVLDDPGGLEKCLSALRRQVGVPTYEIVVVDNGPGEAVRAVALAHDARYTVEHQRSSYAARNRGLREAAGDILAFTDADCVPDENWLAAGCEALEGADLVGGAVNVTVRNPARPTAAELYELVNAFQQQRYVEVEGFSATANLITRRDMFDGVGPFDGTLQSSGDFEWSRRAVAADYRIAFAPRAIVKHPARRTLRALVRKQRRVTRGRMVLRRRGHDMHFPGVRGLLRVPWPMLARDRHHPALQGRTSWFVRYAAMVVVMRWTWAWDLAMYRVAPQRRPLEGVALDLVPDLLFQQHVGRHTSCPDLDVAEDE